MSFENNPTKKTASEVQKVEDKIKDNRPEFNAAIKAARSKLDKEDKKSDPFDVPKGNLNDTPEAAAKAMAALRVREHLSAEEAELPEEIELIKSLAASVSTDKKESKAKTHTKRIKKTIPKDYFIGAHAFYHDGVNKLEYDKEGQFLLEWDGNDPEKVLKNKEQEIEKIEAEIYELQTTLVSIRNDETKRADIVEKIKNLQKKSNGIRSAVKAFRDTKSVKDKIQKKKDALTDKVNDIKNNKNIHEPSNVDQPKFSAGDDVIVKSRTLGKNILGKITLLKDRKMANVMYPNERGGYLVKSVPISELIKWQNEEISKVGGNVEKLINNHNMENIKNNEEQEKLDADKKTDFIKDNNGRIRLVSAKEFAEYNADMKSDLNNIKKAESIPKPKEEVNENKIEAEKLKEFLNNLDREIDDKFKAGIATKTELGRMEELRDSIKKHLRALDNNSFAETKLTSKTTDKTETESKEPTNQKNISKEKDTTVEVNEPDKRLTVDGLLSASQSKGFFGLNFFKGGELKKIIPDNSKRKQIEKLLVAYDKQKKIESNNPGDIKIKADSLELKNKLEDEIFNLDFDQASIENELKNDNLREDFIVTKKEYEKALSSKLSDEEKNRALEKYHKAQGAYNSYLKSNDIYSQQAKSGDLKAVSKEDIQAMEMMSDDEKKMSAQRERDISFKYTEFCKLDDIALRLRLENGVENNSKSKYLWNKVKEAGNWYRKQPMKQKIMMSAGLFGTGLAASALGVGGAVALPLGLAITVSRALSGAGTAVVVDTAIEHGHKKILNKQRTEGLERSSDLSASAVDFFNKNDKSFAAINDAIYKSNKKLESERSLIAGAAGAIVATGIASGALKNIMHWSSGDDVFKKVAGGAIDSFKGAKGYFASLLDHHDKIQISNNAELVKHTVPNPIESTGEHHFSEVKIGGNIRDTAYKAGSLVGATKEQVREALHNTIVKDIRGNDISLDKVKLTNAGVRLEMSPDHSHFIVSSVGKHGTTFGSSLDLTHLQGGDYNTHVDKVTEATKDVFDPAHQTDVINALKEGILPGKDVLFDGNHFAPGVKENLIEQFHNLNSGDEQLRYFESLRKFALSPNLTSEQGYEFMKVRDEMMGDKKFMHFLADKLGIHDKFLQELYKNGGSINASGKLELKFNPDAITDAQMESEKLRLSNIFAKNTDDVNTIKSLVSGHNNTGNLMDELINAEHRMSTSLDVISNIKSGDIPSFVKHDLFIDDKLVAGARTGIEDHFNSLSSDKARIAYLENLHKLSASGLDNAQISEITKIEDHLIKNVFSKADFNHQMDYLALLKKSGNLTLSDKLSHSSSFWNHLQEKNHFGKILGSDNNITVANAVKRAKNVISFGSSDGSFGTHIATSTEVTEARHVIESLQGHNGNEKVVDVMTKI